MKSRRSTASLVTRLGALAALMASVTFASCSGETTAPGEQPPVSIAVRVTATFPAMPQSSVFATQLSFDRAHIVLRRANGSTALDTTVSIGAIVGPLSFNVIARLPVALPAQGEAMILDVRFLNTAGASVFRAGPAPITLGSTPASIALDAAFIGAGASATKVLISPRTTIVNAGADFALSALATDGSNAPIPSAPIEWLSLDSTRATISSAGVGKAQQRRGAAGIIARSITGHADTVFVDVKPVPGSIVAVSGGGQTATIGRATALTLAQPLVVKVTATDGLPLAGATVQFVALNGGSVAPTTAVTDSSGVAQTSWTLANVEGAQSATASMPGLTGSPVTFAATGNAAPIPRATRLVFVTAPSAASSLDSSQPFTMSVAAVNDFGAIDQAFTGDVLVALSTHPGGTRLDGRISEAAVNGIARFERITLGYPATGYRITASSPGLTSATTPLFDVSDHRLSSMYWNSGVLSGARTESTMPPQMLVVQDNGVRRAGVPVTFAVTGGGSVTPASATTNAEGFIMVTWKLGATTEPNTLFAQSVGRTSVGLFTHAFLPQLSLVFPPATVGARQRLVGGLRVQAADANLRIDVAHTRPSSLSLPASVVTDEGQGQTIHAVGIAPGVDTITLSAVKHVSATHVLRVTRPVLSISDVLPSAHAFSPQAYLTLTTTDEVGNTHPTSDTVVVRAVSSDTNVIRPSEPYLRVPKNSSTARAGVTYVGPGRARITYSDSGGHSVDYVSATTNEVVVAPAPLFLEGFGFSVGMTQHGTVAATVHRRLNQPLTITLRSSDTSIVTVPATVTLAANAWEAIVRVTGHSRTGTVQITASAPGYQSVSQQVEVNRPRLVVNATDYLYTTSARRDLYVGTRDEVGNYAAANEDLVATIRSLTPNVVGVDSASVTIRAGLGYNIAAKFYPVGPGVARIVVSDERNVPQKHLPDTITFAVYLPPTDWNISSWNVGVGQYAVARIRLTEPGAPTTASITREPGGHTSAPASILFPLGQREATFNITGVTVGSDQFTVAPAGHAPAGFNVTVGTGRFALAGLPASVRTSDSVLVTVAARYPTDVSDAKVAAATVVTLAPNSNLRIVSGVPNSAPLTSVTIPADASSATFYVKAVSAGSGTLTVSSPNYTSRAESVTITP